MCVECCAFVCVYVPLPVYNMPKFGGVENCTRVWKVRTETVTAVHPMSKWYYSPPRDQSYSLPLWSFIITKVLRRRSRDVLLHVTVLAEAAEPILLVAGGRGDPPAVVDTWMHVLVQWLSVQKQVRPQRGCPWARGWVPWHPAQGSCTAEGTIDSSGCSSASQGAQHRRQLFYYCIAHDNRCLKSSPWQHSEDRN